MYALLHPSFVAVLAWIGAVMMLVGFAATTPEDRAAVKVMGSIVLATVGILYLTEGRI